MHFFKNNLFTVALFATSFTFAQNSKWCGTMDILQQQMDNNPQAQKEYADFIAYSKSSEQNFKYGNASRAFNDTIFIPMVFHIIHNGDAIGTGENISDAQVLSQLPILNQDFSLTNPNAVDIPAEFKSVAGSTSIKFCMAQFDPQGNPTTGIMRYNLGQISWDQNPIEQQVKPSTIWDRTKYLNIWVVRVGGTLATNGVLAYAQFPGFGQANTDGVLARYDVIGNTGTLLTGYDKGRSLGHEIGHWLGLFHIWGDDGGLCSNQTNGGSDYISDTPDQGDQYFGCPTYPQTSCNSSDMFMNYMDYTNDDCRNLFTKGQCDRMESIINSSPTRTGFKTAASKCFYNFDAELTKVVQPSDSLCATDFTPVVLITNKGMSDITSLTITYAINNISTAINWTGLIGAQSAKYIQLPTASGYLDGSYQFDAYISNANGLVKDNNPSNDTLSFIFHTYTEFTTAGPTPFLEDFESGFYPPAGWDVKNPNNDAVSWKENLNVGAYGLSATSVWIDNSAYNINPGKRKDALLTSFVDFSQNLAPKIAFDYAYSKRLTREDSLELSYSLDCGRTWTVCWKNGGPNLATALKDTMRPFVPKANEWRSVSVPVNYLRSQSNVQFKFENISGWGNALYLDNINISLDPNGIATPSKSIAVALYPNPANNFATLKLPTAHPFERYEITDQLGRKVFEKNIIDPISFINTSALTEGVYLIHLIAKTNRQVEKLVIAK